MIKTIPVATDGSKQAMKAVDYAVGLAGQAVALSAKKKVRAKKAIKCGHPVDEIVKDARRSKADLLVIGSRGKSALKAAVLGSVAFGVIHKDTTVPVLVVRN